MKLNQLNRWKELLCVLFGHQFDRHDTTKEGNFILKERWECTCCGLSVYDESGAIKKAIESFK